MLPIQMLQSPSPGPATILLRNRATSAACTFGSTHRATAGARPTRPKTVTSPDATDDLRHQLRPGTVQCSRRGTRQFVGVHPIRIHASRSKRIKLLVQRLVLRAHSRISELSAWGRRSGCGGHATSMSHKYQKHTL
jgi:hypothetical protein